jgi:hypothetical protein
MGDKEEKQQDIRKWIGSPQSGTSGTRRRRVMSTSDSEAEKENRPIGPPQVQHHIDDGNQQVQASAASGNSAPVLQEVIELASTSEDSMFVPLSRRQQSGGAARPAEHVAHGRRAREQPNNQGATTVVLVTRDQEKSNRNTVLKQKKQAIPGVPVQIATKVIPTLKICTGRLLLAYATRATHDPTSADHPCTAPCAQNLRNICNISYDC